MAALLWTLTDCWNRLAYRHADGTADVLGIGHKPTPLLFEGGVSDSQWTALRARA